MQINLYQYDLPISTEKKSITMSIRKIATLGHPILRQVAQEVPVEEIGSDMIQRIILDLLDTVYDANGAGLAARKSMNRYEL